MLHRFLWNSREVSGGMSQVARISPQSRGMKVKCGVCTEGLSGADKQTFYCIVHELNMKVAWLSDCKYQICSE